MRVGALALPVAFVVTFAVPAGTRARGIRHLGLHRVPRHRDRLQPVPGALHRAARRAHRRLRRAHAPAHLAGRRAEPRHPALRCGRSAAASRRRRRRGARLPRHGDRRGARDRRRHVRGHLHRAPGRAGRTARATHPARRVRRGHRRAPPQPPVPRPALRVRAAGPGDRHHARRRELRGRLGAPLRGRADLPVPRADRPRGAVRAALGPARAPHRQGARLPASRARSSRSPRRA